MVENTINIRKSLSLHFLLITNLHEILWQLRKDPSFILYLYLYFLLGHFISDALKQLIRRVEMHPNTSFQTPFIFLLQIIIQF